jgi:hypothetical protein
MVKKSKFFNNLFKKGDGLTINVIIIVVLALLVLIVISFIFGGRAQIFSSAVSKTCEEMGGKCATFRNSDVHRESSAEVLTDARTLVCEDSNLPLKTYTTKKGTCGDQGNRAPWVCCVAIGAS